MDDFLVDFDNIIGEGKVSNEVATTLFSDFVSCLIPLQKTISSSE